jgi:hypothetical protein
MRLTVLMPENRTLPVVVVLQVLAGLILLFNKNPPIP